MKYLLLLLLPTTLLASPKFQYDDQVYYRPNSEDDDYVFYNLHNKRAVIVNYEATNTETCPYKYNINFFQTSLPLISVCEDEVVPALN